MVTNDLSIYIETLIAAIARRGRQDLHSLTAVSNNAGVPDKGGLATLIQTGQVSRLILSYLGNNKILEKKYLGGDIAVELCPQGTLAERIRCGGAGIPAFFTPTGVRMFSFLFLFLFLSFDCICFAGVRYDSNCSDVDRYIPARWKDPGPAGRVWQGVGAW